VKETPHLAHAFPPESAIAGAAIARAACGSGTLGL
jgi:hypothetical protein